MLSELEDEIIILLQNNNQKNRIVSKENAVVKGDEFIIMLRSLTPYISIISALLRDNKITSFEMKLKKEIFKKIVHLDELKRVSNVKCPII